MISGRLCHLRAVEPQDLNKIYEIENDCDLWSCGNTRQPVSRVDVESLLIKGDLDIYQTRQMRLMICDSSDETVGCIDMFDFDPFNMRCGIGIMVDKAYRGKGYASEAVRLMANYLFGTLGMHNIFASMLKSNTASIRLFESCGFKHTGTMERWTKVGERYEDELFFQLTKQ